MKLACLLAFLAVAPTPAVAAGLVTFVNNAGGNIYGIYVGEHHSGFSRKVFNGFLKNGESTKVDLGQVDNYGYICIFDMDVELTTGVEFDSGSGNVFNLCDHPTVVVGDHTFTVQ